MPEYHACCMKDFDVESLLALVGLESILCSATRGNFCSSGTPSFKKPWKCLLGMFKRGVRRGINSMLVKISI